MAVRPYTDSAGRRRYLVEFQQSGQRVLRRLPVGCTAAQATEWETKLRREIFAQEGLGHRPTVLLADVVQGWLNTHPHKHHQMLVNKCNALAKFIAQRPVTDAVAVADEAKREWSEKGQALSTQQRRIAALKAALAWAWKQDMTAENLSARIPLKREHNEREVYLTRAQVMELAKASAYPDAVILAAYTGLRAGELLGLTKANIRDGSIHLVGKGNRRRVVPVAKPALKALEAVPLGISYWQWVKDFQRAREAVGLPDDVTIHGLRHTFASWMINAGVDIGTLAKLMGHSSTAVTQRYAHLYQSTLKKAVGRLR